LIFAWHFIENRIPTGDNLFKRGILNIDAKHCVLVCGSDELLSHLFFACDMLRCGVAFSGGQGFKVLFIIIRLFMLTILIDYMFLF
jgi:hypothetical protein